MNRPSVAVPNENENLSVADLERNQDPSVFVINESPRTHRGDILFEVPRLHGGGADIVRIHKTRIPQDLSEQVPKEQLLQSANFRKTVKRGGLARIVSRSFAESILNTEDAKVESQRIANLESAARVILQSSSVTEQDTETATQKRREANLQRQAEERASDSTRGEDSNTAEDTGFQIFLTSLERHEAEVDILNALRNEAAFTRKELKLIRAKFGDKFEGVEDWVTSMLAKAAAAAAK